MDHPASRLSWALYLAGRGWPVIPLAPGDKRPVFTDWESHASTDPTRITPFFSRRPDCNIGIACGPADLIVLDLDVLKPGQHPPQDGSISRGVVCGAQVLARLADQAGQTVPDTWTVRTPSGGTHLYFRAPAGSRLRNSKGRLGWLIDTRAWGGQVVAPGSATPTGVYELVSDHDPVELRGWLYRLLVQRPATATTAASTSAVHNITRWVAAAVAGECERIATAPSGGHNLAQQKAARALGELVAANVLDYHHALRDMEQAAQPHITGTCDCTARTVQRTLTASLRYGMQHKRQLPAHIAREATVLDPHRLDQEGTAA